MGLTVHHLGHSQSDRLVWLCEELGVTYTLAKYDRSPVLSPPKLIAQHPMGAAPVISDSDTGLVLAETMACVEYILNIYAPPAAREKLTVKPNANTNYADYLYWLHFANGSLQPAIGRCMSLRFAGIDEDNNIVARYESKLDQALTLLDRRVGKAMWLAGEEFTVADVVTVFSLTGMREFYQMDLSKYAGILGYLKRCTQREAYKRAMQKGDPDVDVESLIQGPPPPVFKGLRR